MFGYIYITTNLINGKRYIGKKKSAVFKQDYFGSGKLIRRALNKYGVQNFKIEILETCDDLQSLNNSEVKWINIYNAQESNEFYNIAKGGDGGDLFSCLPIHQKDTIRQKKRIQNLGENNPNYGNGDKIKGDKNPSKKPEVRKKIKPSSFWRKERYVWKNTYKRIYAKKIGNCKK